MLMDQLNFDTATRGSEPKHRWISRLLESYIMENRLPAGTRLPSERDLAERANVTCVTINRSLNELVQRGILSRRIGSGTYVTGVGQKYSIGIVCDRPFDFSNFFNGQVLQTIHRHWIHTADLVYMVHPPEEFRDMIDYYRLSGLFVLSVQENAIPFIQKLRKREFPVVTFGTSLKELGEISFGTDHQKSCHQAVDYLKKHGCQRIAMLSTAISNTAVQERERGYTKAMYEARLPMDPDWIIRKQSLEGPLPEHALRELMQRKDHPDAFLVAFYQDLIPFYHFLMQMGLRIPQDVSVIGFDDPPGIECLSPPLTVFRQPVEEMARQAAQQLENLVRYRRLEKFPSCESILVERGSCRECQ